MKKILFILLITSAVFSQETNKIKFNYISFGGGSYKQQRFESGGINFNIDISLAYKNNLLIFYQAYGLGGNDNKKSIFVFDALNTYSEYDLLYGREFIISNSFKIEGQLGAGSFSQHDSIAEETKKTIGFPIRAKFLFYPSKKFGIGFNQNVNLNNINNIYAFNLIFQFKL